VSLLRKIVHNRQCGLGWPEAMRAALLDWEISQCMGRKQ
jgi:hypothetical protein